MNTGTYISHINHLKRFYDLAFKEQAKTYALQMIDIHVLLFLKNNPDLNTARDIVFMRGLSKSNVSTALEKLRKRELISLREDSKSRRIQRIFLEPAGDRMASELRKTQNWCFEKMLAGFSEEEREKFVQSFCRIDTNVRTEIRNLEQKRRMD